MSNLLVKSLQFGVKSKIISFEFLNKIPKIGELYWFAYFSFQVEKVVSMKTDSLENRVELEYLLTRQIIIALITVG